MTPTAADALTESIADQLVLVIERIQTAIDAGETNTVYPNLFAANVTEIEAAGYVVTDETIDTVIYYTIDWSAT
jgi:hypothetical protein